MKKHIYDIFRKRERKMICEICKEEKYTVFSKKVHSTVVSDISDLASICFACYDTVPEHIPEIQIKKFLKGRYS